MQLHIFSFPLLPFTPLLIYKCSLYNTNLYMFSGQTIFGGSQCKHLEVAHINILVEERQIYEIQ